MTTNLEKLQNWFIAQNDGDWEHTYGVKIETLDNPGWNLQIDLEETDYDHLEMEYTLCENSEHDWYSLRIRDHLFSASGDPTKLDFLIGKFFEIIEPLEIPVEPLEKQETEN